MNNPNKQYDLMEAFQIKSPDVFDIPKEFEKISLNVLQHGGSVPSKGDEIDLETGAIGEVNDIRGNKVVINFPDNTKRNFKISLNNFAAGTLMRTGAAFILDELDDIENIQYSIFLLKKESEFEEPAIIYTINNNIFDHIAATFPISDKIFKFPSLYMWIPQVLWNDKPIDKTLLYAHNYKKHQNILAVQKELAKNNIKIPYKPLYDYLQYINNNFSLIHYPGQDIIQAVINCIINLIEIRTGLMKTLVEKKRLTVPGADFIAMINEQIKHIAAEEDRRLSVGSSEVLFTPITQLTETRRGSSESAKSDRDSATHALVKTYKNAHFSLTAILEAPMATGPLAKQPPPSKTGRHPEDGDSSEDGDSWPAFSDII